MAPVPSQPAPGPCYVATLQQYTWDWTIMLAIEKAESQCNAAAVGPVDYDGLRDYGVLQLHGDPIFTPAANIAVAYKIWQRQGYAAWTSYKTGTYRHYE